MYRLRRRVQRGALEAGEGGVEGGWGGGDIHEGLECISEETTARACFRAVVAVSMHGRTFCHTNLVNQRMPGTYNIARISRKSYGISSPAHLLSAVVQLTEQKRMM